jgi:hypothetical protein
MKVCKNCNTNKDLHSFYKDKRAQDGLCASCKDCHKIRVSKYYFSNLEKVKADKLKHRNVNKDYFRQKKCKWQKENRGKCKLSTAKYRAKRFKATPSWLTTAQLIEIKEFYLRCPPGFHVDHIVPLQGVKVQGLHVPWNLQYLKASENIKKSNRYEF